MEWSVNQTGFDPDVVFVDVLCYAVLCYAVDFVRTGENNCLYGIKTRHDVM